MANEAELPQDDPVFYALHVSFLLDLSVRAELGLFDICMQFSLFLLAQDSKLHLLNTFMTGL